MKENYDNNTDCKHHNIHSRTPFKHYSVDIHKLKNESTSKGVEKDMDAEKHIRDGIRLNQALNGKLPDFVKYFYLVLKSYNIDLMPEMSFDCCKYALEEIRLKNTEFPEHSVPNAVAAGIEKAVEAAQEKASRKAYTPQVKITTDGITNTKVFIDDKELKGVAGVYFSPSYNENQGLPNLCIALKATNVTLDAKMLPALPEPFNHHYIPIGKLMSSEQIPKEEIIKLCRECGINLT